MIGKDTSNFTPDDENNAAEHDNIEDEVSKSQLKRDADAIRELGARLTELGASELATVPLTDDVLSAISEFSRIKAHGARKRQLGFLAKRLRSADIGPIEAALETIRQSARASTLSLHRVERWRDRLTGLDPDESAKAALTAFLDEFPQVERQQLRQLQTQAIKDRQADRPPAAARQLFKLIRDVVNDENNAD